MEINDILTQMARNGVFKDHIKYIRFPKFKNLSENLKIDFNFPITALTGPNGSSKSSILRALQACPEGNSISDYWFETALDRVKDDSINDSDPPAAANSDPQRYIYSYELPSGQIAEVVKTRVYRKNRRYEYWEPGKTRKRDGMKPVKVMSKDDSEYAQASRWKAIERDVLYLDFRAELPAYDILMNFNHRLDKHNGNINSKKNTIRRYASNLQKDIKSGKSHQLWNKERIITPSFRLSDECKNYVSKILGKNYESIFLVHHDYYDYRGWTVLLKLGGSVEYSEAFSGSGEFAVVMLVHKIMGASPSSLIILDEPETSLHPGAQLELINFLKEQIKKSKHQVVISTHSTNIIQSIPSVGIKALDINPDTNRVILKSQATSKAEAFYRLGAPLDVKTIFVEDELAKILVEYSIKNYISEEAFESCNIESAKSGADSIRKHFMPGWSLSSPPVYLILDGDQRNYNIGESLEFSKLSDVDVEKKFSSLNINLSLEGGDDPDIQSKWIDAYKKFLKWYISSVKFLPGLTNPENQLMQFLKPGVVDEYPGLNVWSIHECSFECLSDEGQCVGNRVSPDIGKNFWRDKASESLDKSEVNSQDILQEQRRCIVQLHKNGNKEFEAYLKLVSNLARDWME